MKKKILLLTFSLGMTILTYSQVNVAVNKPLSAADRKEVENILKSFDANSYKIDVKAANGSLTKGMASVNQKTTVVPKDKGTLARTNTNINIFKNAAARTNTNINIFKSSAARTNTNINIFKEGNYTQEQLNQMDKLHNVLSKYQ